MEYNLEVFTFLLNLYLHNTLKYYVDINLTKKVLRRSTLYLVNFQDCYSALMISALERNLSL
jgi:hypothetical protein